MKNVAVNNAGGCIIQYLNLIHREFSTIVKLERCEEKLISKRNKY